MKLRRIHFATDGHIVSDEVLTVAPDTPIGNLFRGSAAQFPVSFMHKDGEEIVWELVSP